MLKSILDFSHHLLKDCIRKGETVVDATCGNGNDTLFLSKLVGLNGNVIGFDVQEQAIATTNELLEKNDCKNVTLIQDTHAKVDVYLSKTRIEKIGGAIFNLGYLPRSDKTIITKGDSTIHAVDILLDFLKVDGIIVLVVYHGHPGGKEEKNQILSYTSHLDQAYFKVLQYGYINQENNPPFIVAIQKRKHRRSYI